jgi:hypothetical protein
LRGQILQQVEYAKIRDEGDVLDWLDADPRRANKLTDVCFAGPLWTPTSVTPETTASAKRPLN